MKLNNSVNILTPFIEIGSLTIILDYITTNVRYLYCAS
jgi:hypothetical protein